MRIQINTQVQKNLLTFHLLLVIKIFAKIRINTWTRHPYVVLGYRIPLIIVMLQKKFPVRWLSVLNNYTLNLISIHLISQYQSWYLLSITVWQEWTRYHMLEYTIRKVSYCYNMNRKVGLCIYDVYCEQWLAQDLSRSRRNNLSPAAAH